jgi:hypothetical protein
MTNLAAMFAIGAALFAQDAPPASKAPVLNAAVSGIVRDKNTGQPLAGYTVSTYVGATWIANAIQMNSGIKQVQVTTDESGRYRLADLPAAPYRLSARTSRLRWFPANTISAHPVTFSAAPAVRVTTGVNTPSRAFRRVSNST